MFQLTNQGLLCNFCRAYCPVWGFSASKWNQEDGGSPATQHNTKCCRPVKNSNSGTLWQTTLLWGKQETSWIVIAVFMPWELPFLTPTWILIRNVVMLIVPLRGKILGFRYHFYRVLHVKPQTVKFFVDIVSPRGSGVSELPWQMMLLWNARFQFHMLPSLVLFRGR